MQLSIQCSPCSCWPSASPAPKPCPNPEPWLGRRPAGTGSAASRQLSSASFVPKDGRGPQGSYHPCSQQLCSAMQSRQSFYISEETQSPGFNVPTPVVGASILFLSFHLIRHLLRKAREAENEGEGGGWGAGFGGGDAAGVMSPQARWAATRISAASAIESDFSAKESDLGRVIYCAQLMSSNAEVDAEKQKALLQSLMDNYNRLPGTRPYTGLMIVYPSCILHIVEGQNNQLFALMRHLCGNGLEEEHGIRDARVISFVLDASSRLFDRWEAAFQEPRQRAVRSKVLDKEATLKAIEAVELFARLISARLCNLSDKAITSCALQDLSGFESSTPKDIDVLALASAEDIPNIRNFVDVFDLDYRLFRSLVTGQVENAEGSTVELANRFPSPASSAVSEDLFQLASQSTDPALLRLTPYYRKHLEKELGSAVRQATLDGSGSNQKKESPLSKFYPKKKSSRLAQYLPKQTPTA